MGYEMWDLLTQIAHHTSQNRTNKTNKTNKTIIADHTSHIVGLKRLLDKINKTN
jgi:hypothetical protein